ncbi:Hsp90 domain-containing protein [Cardiosporidium cionae]|uniref:Hsp90 domain-containing protein n=1 Tax=Cardiosporidium cionae TaxID=476202 RepID=A0ABQ7J6M4_9APIC|nr:Hsp90 domain-containing protein [Cardiosporidium cionae]|eukprot:KAF8819340.1 Hsp90 domain-containing protein [Cardiosporidium cionae]
MKVYVTKSDAFPPMRTNVRSLRLWSYMLLNLCIVTSFLLFLPVRSIRLFAPETGRATSQTWTPVSSREVFVSPFLLVSHAYPKVSSIHNLHPKAKLIPELSIASNVILSASPQVSQQPLISSPNDVGMEPTKNESIEVHSFQAEVSKVMDIIINSLYTNKDVFLREIISNAADACDRKKHLVSKDGKPVEKMELRIKADKDKMCLIVEDNGIGMDKAELITNLGTIARSGTAKWLKQIADGSMDTNLIGKFGVGFYSSYLVANKVDVFSRRFGGNSEISHWSSNSDGTFTISSFEDENFMESGTRLVLHLKEDADEYLEDYKIKELLRKYSEFIQFPIKVWSEKVEYDRVPDTESSTLESKGKMKTITKKTYEWEQINKQDPIWRRNPEEINEQDYHDFYKTTFKAYDNPLTYAFLKVEGQIDFQSILYIPGALPWELARNMFDEESRGIRLYVRRVFINDKFTDATPRWLTFLRGVIDSDDLPLNVGREILQKSRMLSIINKRITLKAIEMIRLLQQAGGAKWDKFWDNFGKYLKVGVVEDRDHQAQIAALIEFWSTTSGANRTTLDAYIDRMKPNQTSIFYVTSESRKAAFESPALEKLRKYGYEVLYSTEPIDEFCLSTLGINKYRDFEVMDVNKADLKLPEDADSKKTTEEKKYMDLSSLCEWIQNEFGKKLQRVVVSQRLVESPAILVQGDFGLSPTMQRYMKQQAASQGISERDIYGLASNQYILEINPDSSIIQQLNHLVKIDKQSKEAKDLIRQLYDVAALQGGYTIEDIPDFSKRVIELMRKNAEESLKYSQSAEVLTDATSV